MVYMPIKHNTLAEEVTEVAMTQLQQSWTFKQPRIQTIRKYRRLYNTQVLPKLRQQFNVPVPIFAGMIDTLQADLNDNLLIEYQNTDPADWKAVEKANAALKQESESARPGALWADKFQAYRFEKIITGRGIMKFMAENDGGYKSALDVVGFEDFHFEPLGGGDLENHLFCGQESIWRSRTDLIKGAQEGRYDKKQVGRLVGRDGGYTHKPANLWDGQVDIVNRFQPLGLDAETNNYTGEQGFHLCEWVIEYKGRRWYLVFEPYSGIWVKFEKNSDMCSADYFPFISSASHKDLKNFASKSFADDLYPVADAVITLFNQDLTNRSKRNLNAKAYDRQMFKDVAKLDEAQYRPDALVPVDTMNGQRTIKEGVYAFETPQLTGTIDLIDWLQRDTGKHLGVTEQQQGAAMPASKRVGVTFAELAQVSKRLTFTSQPFIRAGQQLGERFFVSLKDYMKQPMAVQLLGEKGIEWDVLRRVDLNTKKSFEIGVSSQMQKNNLNEIETTNKTKALEMTAGSTHVNARMRDEMILREVGGFSEHDIALLLDVDTVTDKETLAEVSGAIQEIILRGKKPKQNWNADRYFIKRLLEFAKKHKDTLPTKKYDLLIEYANEHMEIARENVEKEVAADVAEMRRTGQLPAEAGAAATQLPTTSPEVAPIPQ